MKFFSAFAGIGGFDLGIKRAIPDAECVGYSEVDTYAIKIYKEHFPDVTNYGDITRIEPEQLPYIKCFAAGFPCQDISLAGKRAGLYGKRSGLFFDIIRIVREKQPKYVFLENVEGLFSSNKGWDFARMLIELENVGYECEWELLNSKNYGVPQDRKRVYIVGHLGGIAGKPIFPIPSDDKTVELVQGQQINTITKRYYGAQATGSYIIEGELDAQKTRWLTPNELERAQGFPSGWTESIGDKHRYDVLGNAVTVNVIEAIARRFT